MFQLLILHYILSGGNWVEVSRQQSAPITQAACASAVAPAWPKKAVVSGGDKVVLKCVAV
jgi:hypothetical protein